MSSIKGWVSISDVVDEASANLSEYHGHFFGSLYNYAVDCLKRFNYDYANTPKEVFLTYDRTNKRTYLPDDFVNYLGVGYVHHNNVIMLGHNGKMTRPAPDSCGLESLGIGGIPEGLRHMPWDSENVNDLPLNQYWGNGGWPGWGTVGGATLTNYYGYGGGWNTKGYYEVRKDKGWIDFNIDLDLDNVLLVYITNGFSPGQVNMIPEMMALAMKHYIKTQFFYEKMNVSGGAEMRDWRSKAQEEERKWVIEGKNAVRRQTSRPQYELLAAYRRSKGVLRM